MSMTQLTQHAAKRLQQRGIPEQILPLLFDYGEAEYDHHGTRTLYFNKRARERLAKVLGGAAYKRLQGALDTYLVVDNHDCVVTVGHRTHRINRN
jgi:hypothetical protein